MLRDFKKRNAKSPAYKYLPELGIRSFTPMHWMVSSRLGKMVREYVPVIPSLLFAYGTQGALEEIVEKDRSLQFQFKRGGGRGSLMTVPEVEMERFIEAVSNDSNPVYFSPEELTPDKLGKEVIVRGGPLDGYSGILLKMRGSRKKRLIVSIPGFISTAVEVNPDYIQFI